MEIPAKYNPIQAEEKWYKYWMENNFFHSEPDEREPFTIVIPPPNVTGVLHMGHMLNNTIQDVLMRRARMKGLNACWVPGTDHASIATESKVVKKLAEQGIAKNDIGREAFLEHAWDWTREYGGVIQGQLKKLGASCDWERERFTLDEGLSESVIDVFIDLYNKGLIYRGVRMVNWDCIAKTAVSDEEVIHKEVTAKLYYVKYLIIGTDEFITIATTRPETIMGDTAVCVHSEDERYKHLNGKKVLIPFVNREVPIIYDDYIDLEFGTGALKVTPAHDINDYNIGVKHNLQSIDTINEDGTMSAEAAHFEGMTREEARKQTAVELEKMGQLVKTEDLTHSVGFSERTDAVIEPRLSMQWFLKMEDLAKPALDHVMNDDVQFYPEKFKNTHRHWMENIKDWNISRQLWWGHRIPAFYDDKGNIVVAKTEAEAIEKIKEVNPEYKSLRQDEDVLDTWFSSWIWPISVFDGIREPDNEEINYYYPTNDLVTGPDIIFFWVARMIMSGYEYRNERPFKNVYFTGIVRDKIGRKMSKSLGNSPDPIELMEQYGADGVRVGMLLTAPAGNDIPFDDALCEQGRNFSNKIWNAFRLVKGWEVDNSIDQPEASAKAIEWFNAKLSACVTDLEDSYSKFRISEALMTIYKLIWDDFCSWYLEMIKPGYQQPIDGKTLAATIANFEKVLQLLHPFMPFITEELWHLLADRKEGETIMFIQWPTADNTNEKLTKTFEHTAEVVAGIRKVRKEKNISFKNTIELIVVGETSKEMDAVITKMGNIEKLSYATEKPSGALSFRAGAIEYFIPVGDAINVEEEVAKLQQELDYQKGFLNSVQKKLSNERFVNNAPEQVITNERNKQADAEAKIKVLEERLAALA